MTLMSKVRLMAAGPEGGEGGQVMFEWEEQDRFSFEDSDRFEEVQFLKICQNIQVFFLRKLIMFCFDYLGGYIP